jgi:hypothetical protein
MAREGRAQPDPFTAPPPPQTQQVLLTWQKRMPMKTQVTHHLVTSPTYALLKEALKSITHRLPYIVGGRYHVNGG